MNNVEWHGNEATIHVHGKALRILSRAAMTCSRRAKELLSVQGTVKLDSFGKMTRNKKGQFKRQYGSNPSAPGEPPHKQTGRLRMSVTHEIDEANATARVGTNIKYGLYLELGTKKMAARPWLRRALADTAARINQILSGLGES